MTKQQSTNNLEDILLGCLLGHKSPLVPIYMSARKFARHTAILAQSGSGKSFFLGRLIEELLLKADCRVIILDPNSDFVRIDEINEDAWEDSILRSWFLPSDTLKSFAEGWKKIPKAIFTNRTLGSSELPFRVMWSSLNEHEAATLMQIDPHRDAGQYWFLIAVLAIASREYPDGFNFFNFENVAQKLAQVKLERGQVDPSWQKIDSFERFRLFTAEADIGIFLTKLDVLSSWGLWGNRDEAGEKSTNLVASSSDDLRLYLKNRFLSNAAACKLVTIDLQSLDSWREQQLVTALVLDSAWDWARRSQALRLEDLSGPWEQQRTPIFIVIDEAHNLAPASAATVDIVHEQLVRIAAEGRKYDLFLLVVTQNPRKIDPNVLSQCENICILKLSSERDLKSISDVFGYPPVEVAKPSVDFNKGDALLTGPFVKFPLLLHAFPRRTQQGGKGLSNNWASRGKINGKQV